jgi:hypothetical protein
MNTPRTVLAIALILFAAPILRAQQWTAPTPEELSMTSIPEVPGAPAVYLYREQTTDDTMHMYSYYVRLKVLTDAGKDNANVELPYFVGENGNSIDNIGGRTIHPDGSIIPFTGKPYDKLIMKAAGVQEKAKVFTLPGVDVGSIIEYRYKLRYNDDIVSSPDWYVQSDLYVRKAHYMWRPTERYVIDEKGNSIAGRVAYMPLLPEGAKVQTLIAPGHGTDYTLDIANVPPIPRADYMLPQASVSYRVLFYYTAFQTVNEYWTSKGKDWSKQQDKFIGPNGAVADYVRTLITPADPEDQKARKLYAAVMTFDNTRYSREHTSREDREAGFKNLKSTDDVLKRKRGGDDELTQLFIAMARAAGLKAYVMGVASRDERVFLPGYLSTRQLDDLIAIVVIDGKEVYFDPGQRFCEAEHLSWKHSGTTGLRQTDKGTAIADTPPESYKFSTVKRIGDLKLDEHGRAEGTVTLTFTGDPALNWRHKALEGDETSLKTDLHDELTRMLPGGMEVTVDKIENLQEFEQPLKITFKAEGPVGSPTGKRLLVPANLFEANSKPIFTEPKRDIAVDMHYASDIRDAVRFTFPPTVSIESAPEPAKAMMDKSALFTTNVKQTPTSITTFRNLTLGHALFAAGEYPDLHDFYTKVASKDQETLILTHAPTTTTATESKPTGN